jgi:hypothetical protein
MGFKDEDGKIVGFDTLKLKQPPFPKPIFSISY